MIESAGGMIPFLCHVFLIFFGAFFALNLSFNKNFTKSFGYDSIQASYMGRPLGFMMSGLVLMFIATLFQIAGFSSTYEIFTVLFVFTVLGFLYNLALFLKILPTYDDSPHEIKHAIRPLIPLIVIIIRALTL